LASIRQKFKWLVTRHPMLYYVRFAMICKNYKGKTEALPTFADRNRKEDVAPVFLKVNSEIPLDNNGDGFEKTMEISRWLRFKIKGGRGLGLSSDKALEMMLDGQGGICSDYSQMLNVFCLINDIPVREWGTVEKFYNPVRGHNYNEIWSEKRQKWIAIDFQKNLWFKKTGENEPLSVIELFAYLRGGNELAYEYFSDWRCIDMYKIDKTYSKNSIPFLIANYDNKVYDHYLNKYQDRYPSFVINAMMILMRKNYNFLFVMDNYKRKLFPSSKKTD
jgi:hypothetical protein